MMSACGTIVMLRWTQAGERRDDLELAAKLSAVSFRFWPVSASHQPVAADSYTAHSGLRLRNSGVQQIAVCRCP